MSSAKPVPAASLRTTRAAPGTYGTRDPGRTMLGRHPMSRVELAPSYRASQVRPASCGTMRGATAPTAGSAKCGSSASSQPAPGTQSESRKATSGVCAAARPVFLAAAGPPLTGRRTTLAPAAAAALWIAAGSARAVVHHDHPRRARARQPGQAAGQFGVPVADRDDHRHLRPFGLASIQHGMRDPGVEQAAGQRAGLRVARHRGAVPPAGHVPGPGRAEPQHPDGVTARDHRPVGQRARPRIGAQPESRRDQLVVWPLACEDRRPSASASWFPPPPAQGITDGPAHPPPSVTARYALVTCWHWGVDPAVGAEPSGPTRFPGKSARLWQSLLCWPRRAIGACQHGGS